MPILEGRCPSCGFRTEHFYHHADDVIYCDACGSVAERMASRFAVVFSGVIGSKYKDKNGPGGYKDGTWAWDKDIPEIGQKAGPRYLETFQDQKEYCKRNKLINPKDLGPVEVGSDGKSVSTRGLPGSY